MTKKSDGNTVTLRIAEIATMLINGSCRGDIVQFIAEKWSVGERMSDNYIKKAKEEITLSVKKDIQYDYAKAIRRYEFLYQKVIEKNDYKTALAINKELTNLQGLLVNQIEHTGEIQFINSVPN